MPMIFLWNINQIVGHTAVILITLANINGVNTVSMHNKTSVRPLCPRDKFYTLHPVNLNGTCQRCSVCPRGSKAVSRCMEMSDTVCTLCPTGTYNDVKGGICKTCSTCQPGTYRRRPCSPRRDTICRTCPRHFHSAFEGVSVCRRCRKCRPHERTIKKCTNTTDTVCGSCKKGYFRVFGNDQCLPCSLCPLRYSNQIVKDCQDATHIADPIKCWPSVNVDYLRSGSEGEYPDLTPTTVPTQWNDSGGPTSNRTSKERHNEFNYTFWTVNFVVFVFSGMLILITLTIVCIHRKTTLGVTCSSHDDSISQHWVSIEHVPSVCGIRKEGSLILDSSTCDVHQTSHVPDSVVYMYMKAVSQVNDVKQWD